ncbi:MAG: hypothetical protein ING36_03640 [Burkholderiales bacterium]|jgi:hypothetical protein|nr:hypothetical protein [Burkholderiales bacterium]
MDEREKILRLLRDALPYVVVGEKWAGRLPALSVEISKLLSSICKEGGLYE